MSFFICQNCGFGSASWYGKCPECGSWNSFTEKNDFSESKKNNKEPIKKISITSLKSIKTSEKKRIKTGF
ncbi:MAG: DNA repair protein RadA, partial [Patescibacteria group bacterium]|nr:DNA repair protein RadA [Patescibacteria group bacterium]